MTFKFKRWFACMAVLFLCLPAQGCVGWFDLFAPQKKLSGDFALQQGESASLQFYLMSKGQSGSVAGPLHQLGWNEQYIIFTDANWPEPRNVIRVKDHSKFTITEALRTTDPAFKVIPIMSPTDAWNLKKR